MDENKRGLFAELKLLYVEITVVLPSKNPAEAAAIFKIKTGHDYKKSKVAQIIDSATNIVDKYEKLIKAVVAVFLIAAGIFAYLMPTPPPVPVPVPVPVPAFKTDSKLEASNSRLKRLSATAEKWRSRTAPIYENLADLLGSITTYDQSRFDNQPSSEEAWDYLQSIQKIISSETDKIRSQDKSAISINVDVTGVGDVGDRAAKILDDWLGSHRFNTSKNGSMIYVTVKGSQESHHNNYTSQKDANTSLWINAEWLDGSLFFESKVGPVLASAGSNTDAENHSFDGAVSKMISVFRSHVD